jgi:alanine racemase
MSVEVLISEGALRHNLKTLSSKVAPTELMFVVKSNGYGHGVIAVSKIAEDAGIKWLGVLEIPAALELRSVISNPDVNILAWQFDKFDSLEEVAAKNIQLGVGDFAQLKQLSSYSNVKVSVKETLAPLETTLQRHLVIPSARWHHLPWRWFVTLTRTLLISRTTTMAELKNQQFFPHVSQTF